MTALHTARPRGPADNPLAARTCEADGAAQWPTLYFVVVDFPRLGLGSAGDCTTSWDAACDQYAEMAVAEDYPTQVRRMDQDGTWADVTDDARAVVLAHRAA